MQNRFDTYYDPTVTSIKAILFTETDPSKCLLRAQCLECISYVANAVGKDRFTNDARQVIIHHRFYLERTVLQKRQSVVQQLFIIDECTISFILR